MKGWTRSTARAIVMSFVVTACLVTVPGCDNNDSSPLAPCDPSIAAHRIVVNPLAPAPGEVATLVMEATGEGCGSWPEYRWRASGGTLLGDSGVSVKWEAPEAFGTYRIVCRASLEGNADSAVAWVMVRKFEYIDTGRKASLHPRMSFTSLIFISEAGNFGPRDENFLGWAVFRWNAPENSMKITDTGEAPGGTGFNFAGDSWIWGSFISQYFVGFRQQRMNVWRFPTTALGTSLNVSSDTGGAIAGRRNQHGHPNANPTGSMAVWRYHFIGSDAAGTKDLFNIAFWHESLGQGGWYTVTQSHDSMTVRIGNEDVVKHRYYRNIKPMFTPDENAILYFVDTTGVFEPCLIPMAGAAPDTMQRRDLGGLFKAAGVGTANRTINEATVFEWKPGPAPHVLGFVAAGQIALFDHTAEAVTVVEDLSQVGQIAWSPDGDLMAAATGSGIYLVSPAGAVSPSPVFTLERSTDEIVGLAFSPSNTERKLGFSLIRKGKTVVDSWSALVIVDLSTGVWTFASPKVPWSSTRDPAVPYTWMRVMWEADNQGMYAPFVFQLPELPSPRDETIHPDYDRYKFIGDDRDIVIFRSYGS